MGKNFPMENKYLKRRNIMPKLEDLTNQKFGRLTVIKRAPNKNGRTAW